MTDSDSDTGQTCLWLLSTATSVALKRPHHRYPNVRVESFGVCCNELQSLLAFSFDSALSSGDTHDDSAERRDEPVPIAIRMVNMSARLRFVPL